MKNSKKSKHLFAKTLTIYLAVFLLSSLLTSCLAPGTSSTSSPSTTSDNNAQNTPEPTPTPAPTPNPTPVPNPVPNPIPVPVVDYDAKIKDIATKSSCAQTSWTDRGRAPMAYIKGMALSYARSLCRIRATPQKAGASILSAATSGNAAKDVLAHYSDILANAGLRINSVGDEPLHATYTIGMGLGMRESSGKYCEGYDVAAGTDRTSAEAEAGLFQASYNSMSASTELRKLYEEYQADESRCMLATFKEGVSCTSRSLLGTGAGADYQSFVKRCPAFAVEYTMTLIRVLRAHFGPLNRQTAQVVPSCDSMLSQVQTLVEANPEVACSELF